MWKLLEDLVYIFGVISSYPLCPVQNCIKHVCLLLVLCLSHCFSCMALCSDMVDSIKTHIKVLSITIWVFCFTKYFSVQSLPGMYTLSGSQSSCLCGLLMDLPLSHVPKPLFEESSGWTVVPALGIPYILQIH